MRGCAPERVCAGAHARVWVCAHTHARGKVQKFVFFGPRGARNDSSAGRSGPPYCISPYHTHILL